MPLSFILVQVVSLCKVAAAVAFAALVGRPEWGIWAILLYLCAMSIDFLDGFLARGLGVASSVGAAFDTTGDKFLTIASAVYLVQRGIAPVPLLMIPIRDVLLQALRTVWHEGAPVVPTVRWLGIVTITPMRLATLWIVLHPAWGAERVETWSWMFWAIAALSLTSTGYTLWASRGRILVAAGQDRR